MASESHEHQTGDLLKMARELDEEVYQQKRDATNLPRLSPEEMTLERSIKLMNELAKPPGEQSLSIDEFVDLPGFFRVERGSCATGPLDSVHVYQVGADPLDGDGRPSGRVHWGSGASIAGALEDWWEKCRQKCRQFDPRGNAAKHWERTRARMFPGNPRGG